jgi:hypothetical protein
MEQLTEDSLFSRDRVPGSRRDRWTLTDYARLDQAPGAAAERVRRLMDSWYRRLPAHARTEIRQRFTSPKLGAHLGAFWEMYLYEAASRLKLKVDLDVGRDHGSRRPDLLVGANEGDHFIEATVALGDGAVRRDQRARADQFYAAIERVRNRDFLLHPELRAVGNATPGRKLVADPLDRWLSKLDPDTVRRNVDAGQPAPAFTIKRDGWFARIEATGKHVELRGDRGTGVIGIHVEGFKENAEGEDLLREIDDITPLTNVLLKKAGHGYELGDRAFVIAVLCAGDFIEEQDIAQALFGPIEYRLSVDSDRANGAFQPGGLWHDTDGPRYTSVSAVLTASNLTPGAVAAVEARLWLNPDAAHPIGPSLLPWQRWEIDPRGRFVEHPASQSAAELFGLPARWPAEDADEPSVSRESE